MIIDVLKHKSNLIIREEIDVDTLTSTIHYYNKTNNTYELISDLSDEEKIYYGNIHPEYKKILDFVTPYQVFPSNLDYKILSYNVTNDLNLILTIDFEETILLNDVQYDLTINTLPIVKIEYSNDAYTFEEHNFISYTVHNLIDYSNEEQNVITNYQNFLIKVQRTSRYFSGLRQLGDTYILTDENGVEITVSNTELFNISETTNGLYLTSIFIIVYEKNTLIPLVIDSTSMTILRTVLNHNFSTNQDIDIQYEFTYYDKFLATTKYLLNDRMTKSVRITFNNITSNFSLNYLKLFSNEAIELENHDFNYIATTLFQPKYFQTYPFIQSICNSYFDMLVYEYEKPIVAVILNAIPQYEIRNTQEFDIGGDDIIQYKYKLDNGTWTQFGVSINVQIQLTDLSEGTHTIYVIGKNSFNKWQSIDEPTTATWIVDTLPPVTSISL